MRKSVCSGLLLGATTAVVMAALIDAAGFGSSAFAQTAGTAGPVTINGLFTGDSMDLDRDAAQRLVDAARRAQAPGECPLGRLTINTPASDPLFQDALGAARRDAVLAFLDRQGVRASRFFADVKVGGTQSNVRLDYNVARDDIAPTLDVTWTPPKGTKVKADQKITAKAVARDDANDWQSGIKTIDLDVQGGGQFGFGDYPQPPQTCESLPPPRTLEGVYTVHANPPPIVRLRANAKDFVGHSTQDIAEFPTGDWYGTLTFDSESVVLGVTTTFRDRMDIALEYDGRGNLEGTLVGDRHFKQNSPDCPWEITIPNKLRGRLVGSYTPGAEVMSIQLIEPAIAPAPRKNCPKGGFIYSGGSIHEAPQFKNTLQSPKKAGDGTFRSSTEWADGAGTARLSLTLRRARN